MFSDNLVPTRAGSSGPDHPPSTVPDIPADVTAIVAAYNEAGRIGAVLDVLTTYPGFREVIVVDDGSTDGTGDEARRYPVTYIRLEPNRGKGQALDAGVERAETEVVFFADADIRGLTHDMITATCRPVLDGECDMFVLMRNRRIYVLRSVMAFIPLLGGERALTKKLWQSLPDRYKRGFRIEAGLNFFAVHHGRGLRYRVFPGVFQTVKEEKYGLVDGFRRRLRMFREVLGAAWELQRRDLPDTARSKRTAFFSALFSAFGLTVGLLMAAAGVTGPAAFVSRIFSGDLDGPLVRTLIAVADNASRGAFATVGTILALLNTGFLVVALIRLLTVDRLRRPG